jgi:hypothetical protein
MYHPKHVEEFPDKINCVTLRLVGHILEDACIDYFIIPFTQFLLTVEYYKTDILQYDVSSVTVNVGRVDVIEVK